MTKENISDFTWRFFNIPEGCSSKGFVVERVIPGQKHNCMHEFHVQPEEMSLKEIFDIFNSTFTDDGNFRPEA